MRRIVEFFFGLTLAAPTYAVVNIPQPPPVKSIDWLPASTVRVGQGINAAYRITTQAGKTSEIWLHTNCISQDKLLLFIDVKPGKGPRAYGAESFERYTPGKAFEVGADSLFKTDPELNICKKSIPESKWEGIPSWKQAGEKLYVDTNNSLRDKGLLKTRLAIDYDVIRHDKKYGAPYSVKIQDVIFNCKKSEVMPLATFLLDNEGVVSDTTYINDPIFTPVSSNIIGVEKELCGAKDLTRFKGNGKLVWRAKKVIDDTLVLPDLENNTSDVLHHFPFPEEVTGAIDKIFSDPQQRPNFRSLRYTQSGPENDDIGLMARVDPQPDGTTLSIVKMTIANVAFYSQYQRLFNIVDMKKWEALSDSPWVSNELESTFAVPVRHEENYTSSIRFTNKDKPGSEKLTNQACVVAPEWHKGSDLNPEFPGRYLELICREDRGDGAEASSDYAYLETLRVFIRIGYKDNGKKKRFNFTDVKVTY
ncbi:hypothetical protein ACLBW2_19925 [Enterobacteriaceae bacterium C23F]